MKKIITIFALLLLTSCAEEPKGTLLEEMTKLAENGSAEAAYHMGMFYNNGLGVDENPAEALKWFETATDAGDPLGAYKLGCYYAGQFGDVVEVDAETAFKNKLIAANAGYALAQHDIGIMYLNFGNPTQAVKYLSRAAEQGVDGAYNTLSLLYYRGDMIPPDVIRAHSFLRLAVIEMSDEEASQYGQIIAQVESNMTEEQIDQSNEAVENWEISPSALTKIARQGLERSYELADLPVPAE